MIGGADYCEPSDARKPTDKWRIYLFPRIPPHQQQQQQQQQQQAQVHAQQQGAPEATLHVHRQSCYRFGRRPEGNDVPLGDLSCSGYHAVLQYRVRPARDSAGRVVPEVKPYLLDLGSVNGTFLGGKRLEPLRYYEVMHGDVAMFGDLGKEFVFLKAP